MNIETTILDFQLSNSFQEDESYMNAMLHRRCLENWELKHFKLVNY